jgi:hypothetical protein
MGLAHAHGPADEHGRLALEKAQAGQVADEGGRGRQPIPAFRGDA